MAKIQTPTLDRLVQELQTGQQMADMVDELQMANNSLNAEHERISALILDANARAEKNAQHNDTLQALVPGLEQKLMFAEAALADSRAEADQLRNEVSVAREGRRVSEDMNTNLHRVIMNLQSELRILKRKVGEE